MIAKCTAAPADRQCHYAPGHDGPCAVTFTEPLRCDCERVDELRAWATSRINFCKSARTQWESQREPQRQQELVTLEAVLRILDGKETP